MMSNEQHPKVIVIAGPNGSGKSTLAPFLLRDRLHLTDYVNADTLAQGLSAFQPEKVAIEAGRIMLNRLHSLARREENFAFESTLATRSYRPWLQSLLKAGYQFHLLYLWLQSEQLAMQRVQERVRMGGHDILPDVIIRRYRKSITNFFELYRPLASTWVIYDNSYVGEPHIVAKGTSDTLIEVYEPSLWRNFCELGK